MPKAHLISIGNELLIGDTVNTNASWIGGRLTAAGFDVEASFVIADDAGAIRTTIRSSMKAADLVITTGGLGPTHDDVTKKTVAEVFSRAMVRDEKVLAYIEKVFADRNLPMSQSNRDQALIPEGAHVLFNAKGTAPGLWFDSPEGILVVLPGVPHEMRYLMDTHVLPEWSRRHPGLVGSPRLYLNTAGEAESVLSEQMLGNLDSFFDQGCTLAYLPGSGRVILRLGCRHQDPEEASRRLHVFAEAIRERARFCLFGEGEGLALAEALGKALQQRGWTFVSAESCTGGALCNAMTDIPGSSSYVLGAFVTYSNTMKTSQLGVLPDTLSEYGAVSRQVVMEMARGARDRSGADVAVSLSGVAGPGGGTEEKPVGLVWLGVVTPQEEFALRLMLTDDRRLNKERSVMIAMEALRRSLAGIERMPYGLPKLMEE